MAFSFKQYIQKHTRITEAQFDQIADRWDLAPRTYTKGRILLHQGDLSGYIYFVTKGILRSYLVDVNNKEHIIQFAPENWWMGERNSSLFNEPAAYYIDVVEDAEVVRLENQFIENAQKICPEFVQLNTYLLNNNIRHLQNRICQLLGASAEERYLNFIHLYPDLTLRVSQIMIASYLGITPESLSRVRRELASKYAKH